MTAMSDEELRARFESLSAHDRREAPSFAVLTDRATRAAHRARPRRAWRLAMAIALAAAVVLSVGIARIVRRMSFVPTPLAAWTSPTAGLLKTPGSDLLASPALLSSQLDHLTTTLAQREGNLP